MPENFYRPTHGRTLNWYVRLVPPSPLKGRVGVAEFRKSTGTADLRKAKTVGAQLIAEKRAAWDQLLTAANGPKVGPRVLNSELVDHICARRLYHWMRLDDLGRFEGMGHDDQSRDALTLLCKANDASMRSVLARGRASDGWHKSLDVLDFWCEQIATPVSRTDPLYPRLARQFAEVELDASGRLARRNQGEPASTPEAPRPAGSSLSAMTAAYREHKGQTCGGKHLGTSVNVWLKLVEHLGDVPLSAVRASDLYGFLEARLRAPVKPWSTQHAHGLVRRTLREVFALARTHGMLVGANPVDDLDLMPRLTTKEENARRKPRHPFTDPQLSALLTSEWYRADASRWRGKMAADLGARYWVPLLGLFHGNRVREALQLVASDIEQHNGAIVIRFQDEMEGEQAAMVAAGVSRSLKNDPTKRVVPLHPTLIALGFVEFVEQRRGEGGTNAMLFPSSIPRPGGKSPILGRAYEQAFLRFVRDELGFGRGFGNHSFRHQLEDRIRDAQMPGQRWPAGLAQAYTGRKRTRSNDRGHFEEESSERDYGRGHLAEMMLRYVKTLAFDGITMPPPFAAWLRATRP